MTKTEYIIRSFRHTHHKDYENYVVTGIWHRLRLSAIPCDLQPVTQQYVKRSNGSYALLDLYFPAIRLAVECDEAYHLQNAARDLERENDVKNAILPRPDQELAAEDESSIMIERVDASRDLDNIDHRLDEITSIILKRYEEMGSPIWDSRSAEERMADVGMLTVSDGLIFSTTASVLQGLNVRKENGDAYSYWATGSFPLGDNAVVWFPHLSTSVAKWNNILKKEGDRIIIEEARAVGDERQRIAANRYWNKEVEVLRGGRDAIRIVFAHSVDALGAQGYKFMGMFKLVRYETATGESAPTKMIFERFSDRVSKFPSGTTIFKRR